MHLKEFVYSNAALSVNGWMGIYVSNGVLLKYCHKVEGLRRDGCLKDGQNQRI